MHLFKKSFPQRAFDDPSLKGKKKILFAVGGTGGHIFPAQALARDLKEKEPDLQILFAGSKLTSNNYFKKELFGFYEIESESPFRKNPLQALLKIIKGLRKSFSLIKQYSPDLIVGFGSFHSFPLLLAAKWKKLPYILFESNVIPGKVNRFFSAQAKYTAIQFEETKLHLKGKTLLIQMPSWYKKHQNSSLSAAEARQYFGLSKDLFTILIFGGSQGALRINEAAKEISVNFPFQILHFCGRDQNRENLSNYYQQRGIIALVKPFEDRMDIAWRAASLVVCRSGAGTLAELLDYQVPAILVPWPGASDDHQKKNAEVFVKNQGAFILLQKDLNGVTLSALVTKAYRQIEEMKGNLHSFLCTCKTEDLSSLILQLGELK